MTGEEPCCDTLVIELRLLREIQELRSARSVVETRPALAVDANKLRWARMLCRDLAEALTVNRLGSEAERQAPMRLLEWIEQLAGSLGVESPGAKDDLELALRQLEETNQGLERLKTELEARMHRTHDMLSGLHDAATISPELWRQIVESSVPNATEEATDKGTTKKSLR